MAIATDLDFPDNPLGRAFQLTFRLRSWKSIRNAPRCRCLTRDWLAFFQRNAIGSLDDITSEHMALYVEERTEHGDSPSTVGSRLTLLATVAEEAQNARPPLATRGLPRIRKPRAVPREKWWLPPASVDGLVAAIRDDIGDDLVADYVLFVCETGLRVEEALRLQARHFVGLDGDRPYVIVPGTKTAASRRPLPISRRAASVARGRLETRCAGGVGASPTDFLFPASYYSLKRRWAMYRRKLGLGGVEGATLKAFRRSFAGKLHQSGCPTETIMRLMRHSEIGTTSEYLKLVRMGDLEPARRWL